MQSQQRNRRGRIPLSCDPCRTRKLKCNREWPCQNCRARDEHAVAVAACKFRGVAPKNDMLTAVPLAERHASGDGTGSLRRRINDLEDMVKRLIEHQAPHTPSSGPSVGVNTPEGARVAVEAGIEGRTILGPDGHSIYHGGDALHTLLEEINELKDHVIDAGYCPTISSSVDGPSLLFLQPKPVERIISSFPPKHEVDALVSQFFSLTRQASPLGVPSIIHQPTFMREYDENWTDLSQASFIWLGLLFSMLGISMLAYREYGEPPEYKGKSELLLQLYRKRAAQCLHSGDIAKCLPYTVETLRLNAVAEGHRRDDNQRGLWIMAGIIVRTAINMGYHCEPPPTISTFQSEYRRRIWSSVISMDEIFSFLGGFPYMTPERYSDTAEPRNLHDWELAEDMTVLPPSRPLSEPTSVTYQIAKSRLARALGRIADFNWNQGSYESLVEIDRALQQTYLGLPSQMKFHLAERDNAACTMADWANLSIHVNYLKGTCTLHRRSLTKARVDARYTFSRDRCISAALDILALQQRLPVSFYKVSQVRQIFALGAMVLLLELGLRLKNPVAEQASDVILQTLERACVSWAVAGRKGCDDTSKVYQLLSRLLSAFQTNSPNSSNPQMMQVASLPDEEPVVPPWLEVSGGGFMSGYETSNADFDWTSWDAFIGDAGPEYGHIG